MVTVNKTTIICLFPLKRIIHYTRLSLRMMISSWKDYSHPVDSSTSQLWTKSSFDLSKFSHDPSFITTFLCFQLHCPELEFTLFQLSYAFLWLHRNFSSHYSMFHLVNYLITILSLTRLNNTLGTPLEIWCRILSIYVSTNHFSPMLGRKCGPVISISTWGKALH